MQRGFLKIFLVFLSYQLPAQIPDIDVQNGGGMVVKFADSFKTEKPTLVTFWATWCKPCLLELQAISQSYDPVNSNYTLIAVSIDEIRNRQRALGLAKSKNWNFEVLFDYNGDLQRSLQVFSVPNTLIFDQSGKIIHRSTNFVKGKEQTYFELINAL